MHRLGDFLSRRAIVAGLAASALTPWNISTASAPYSRGGRLLPGIQHRAQVQNVLAAQVDDILKSDAEYMSRIGADNPLVAPSAPLPKEWRTPVAIAKDQETCGSCFVFAAIGAFEETYKKFNRGYPSVSVQEALDCTYGDDNCAIGGHHETVFLYLQLYGLADFAGVFLAIQGHQAILHNECSSRLLVGELGLCGECRFGNPHSSR